MNKNYFVTFSVVLTVKAEGEDMADAVERAESAVVSGMAPDVEDIGALSLVEVEEEEDYGD